MVRSLSINRNGPLKAYICRRFGLGELTQELRPMTARDKTRLCVGHDRFCDMVAEKRRGVDDA